MRTFEIKLYYNYFGKQYFSTKILYINKTGVHAIHDSGH